MSKKMFLFATWLIVVAHVNAQKNQWWEKVNNTTIDWKKYNIHSLPESYSIYRLDLNALRQSLNLAPHERQLVFGESNAIIQFPTSDGKMTEFRLVQAPVMDEKLAARYPGISSYAGVSVSDPLLRIRLDCSPFGMNAVIHHPKTGSWYIDHIEGNMFRGALRSSLTSLSDFQCSTTALTSSNTSRVANANQSVLRTYRLAMISGAEFSNFFVTNADTTTALKKARVLAAQNAHMTRANAIFERDFSIRLVLVPNNDTLIYFDAANDPVSSPNSPSNTSLQTAINARIGQTNYDIGHTESLGSNNGNAGCIGCVCSTNKGLGWTVYSNPSLLDFFVVDYLTHEFGHQLGANHTFSYNTEGTGVNMEPGSGITIMGYAGITGANTDIAPHSIDHFHCKSIEQVTTYLYTGAGNGCAVQIANGNNIPTVNAGLDYVIPKSTPFVLTGSGTDADPGNVLTYSWEQIDNRTTGGTTPVSTATTGPMFRTYSPTTSPSRTFPRLNYVLDNANAFKWETLPSVGRTMNFRLQVRDNSNLGGGTASDNMIVTVNGTAGPFAVSSPNTVVSWPSGSAQTITWSVNSTNLAPVSCSKVRISLSTDGGNSFPFLLADSTANDGSELLTLPSIITTQARLKIEAIGNIFFDISNVNFNITNVNSIIPTFNSIPAFCAGSIAPTLPTTSLNGIVGTWSPALVSNSTSDSYVFTPNAGQNANTTSISVTVNPLPTVSVNNTNICSGQSAVLTATGANSYSWIFQSGMSDTTGAFITVTPTLNSQYIVIGTNTSTGCTGRDTAFVTLQLGPATPVSSNGNIASVYRRFDSSSQFIPDRDSIGILSNPIVFAGLPANAQVVEMRIGFNITHSYVGDLRINLIAPNGQNISLVAALNNGAGTNTTDNFTNTIISSIGTTALSGFVAPRTGVFAADRRLGAGPINRIQTTANWTDMFGTLNGSWRLAIADFVTTDSGRLFNWFIEIRYSSPDILTNTQSCGASSLKLNVNLDSTRVVDWYSDAALTQLIQSGHTHFATPVLNNSANYFAAARNPLTGCKSANALNVLAKIDTPFSFNPFTDTLITCQSNTTLNAGNGFDLYAWSNGDSTNQQIVTETGLYTCTVNKGVCTQSDSIWVGLIRSKILNADTSICTGQSVALSAEQQPISVSYQWSNGVVGLSNIVTPVVNTVFKLSVSGTGFICNQDSVRIQTGASIPTTPATITITPLVTNICGSKTYRYSAPSLPTTAEGYAWSFVGALGNSAVIDSGSFQSQKMVVRFTSDAASGIGDSVKLQYVSPCGNSNFRTLKLTNTGLSAPTAPASITIQPVSVNTCGARIYRYIAPALPPSTTSTMPATGWQWNFIGSLSEFAMLDSGTLQSKVIRVLFTSNQAALSGDSVQLWFTSACGDSKIKTTKLTNGGLNPPSAPASILITPLQTNVCGVRRYRYTALNLPVATTTAGAATGWEWSIVGALGGSALIDSGSLQSQKLILSFSSNAAAGAGDSIRVRYTSNCGNSPYRSVKLTNTALNPPTAPASIIITPLQTNVCGARRYRYSAPNLPLATTTAGAATGWNWSIIGVLGGSATIDSGSLQAQKLILSFSSNAAAGAGDSIRIRFSSACGFSANRSLRFSNTILNPPAAPTSIIIQQVLPDSCGSRRYRYLAPNLPVATTTSGAASGYSWSLPTGFVGSTGVLDSGDLTGQRIRIRYSSNTAAGTGDSIRLRYNSGCGLSNPKAQRLSNLLKNCPNVKRLPISFIPSASQLFPNPSNGNFKLVIPASVIPNLKQVRLEIYDQSGKLCLQQLVAVRDGGLQHQMHLREWRSGNYWLRCSDGKQWNRTFPFRIQ